MAVGKCSESDHYAPHNAHIHVTGFSGRSVGVTGFGKTRQMACHTSLLANHCSLTFNKFLHSINMSWRVPLLRNVLEYLELLFSVCLDTQHDIELHAVLQSILLLYKYNIENIPMSGIDSLFVT